MENSIRTQCEQSFYEELYHYGSGKRSIVMDRVSERAYFQKVLSVYNIDVFRYLKSHSNIHIPKVHSFWEEDGKLVVIEELISGYTLDYLLENEKMDDVRKKDILLQICDGLIFLHSAEPQIIHRNLKPSNIMVTDDNTVKIIDYDAAKVFDRNEEKDTVLIGTRGSAAPEQYGFGKCDERTDIYALFMGSNNNVIGYSSNYITDGDLSLQPGASLSAQLDAYDAFDHVDCYITGRAD
jgi:serine/threonine protein kinase